MSGAVCAFNISISYNIPVCCVNLDISSVTECTCLCQRGFSGVQSMSTLCAYYYSYVLVFVQRILEILCNSYC